MVPSTLIALLALPWVAHAAAPAREQNKSEPTRKQVAVYAVEFDGDCGPPVYRSSLGSIVTSSAPKDWVRAVAGSPPLVSREAVVYSVVGTSGETSLPAARVFAEVRRGGLSFTSDKGQNVVLQADVKSVCWDIDQAKAVDLARAAGSRQALLAVVRSEDLTAQANPGGELGHQRSVRVSLDMTLVDTGSGAVIGSFSEEARQMDSSAAAATRRAAKSLVAAGFRSLTSTK